MDYDMCCCLLGQSTDKGKIKVFFLGEGVSVRTLAGYDSLESQTAQPGPGGRAASHDFNLLRFVRWLQVCCSELHQEAAGAHHGAASVAPRVEHYH